MKIRIKRTEKLGFRNFYLIKNIYTESEFLLFVRDDNCMILHEGVGEWCFYSRKQVLCNLNDNWEIIREITEPIELEI